MHDFEYKSRNDYAKSAKHKYDKKLIDFFEKLFNYDMTLKQIEETYSSEI